MFFLIYHLLSDNYNAMYNEIVSEGNFDYVFVTLRVRRSSNNKFTDPNLTETSAVLIRYFDGEKRN